MFILAAAGSAVGLGNIWKFPYMAGDNGGGAFIAVYLICVFVVGIPIMMAEVLMGRETRSSPINTMRQLVENVKGSLDGWLQKLAGAVFNDFLARPGLLVFWQTVFMTLTIWIVARGVSGGLELAIRYFMPLLFVLLLVLLGYSMTTGGFAEGAAFMFSFHPERLGVEGVLDAMGQAFFTLSLGMGAIMAYGAYLPSNASVTSTVIIIALLDTFVAIASGLVIFPLVFANGLEPSQGPGLMFVTLPLAFGQMPLGVVFGSVFFVLVSFAAITSAISLTEPALAWLVEDYNAKRSRVAITLGVITWLLGLGTVFSFNIWSDVHLIGNRTFFDVLDYAANNVMLPLGGLLMALFVGFVLPRQLVQGQLGLRRRPLQALSAVDPVRGAAGRGGDLRLHDLPVRDELSASCRMCPVRRWCPSRPGACSTWSTTSSRIPNSCPGVPLPGCSSGRPIPWWPSWPSRAAASPSASPPVT